MKHKNKTVGLNKMIRMTLKMMMMMIIIIIKFMFIDVPS